MFHSLLSFILMSSLSVVQVSDVLINLLDGWSTAATAGWWCISAHTSWHTSWHTARHSSWSTTFSLVQLGDDWGAHFLQFFLFLLIFFLCCLLVRIHPANNVRALIHDEFFVLLTDFVLVLVIIGCGLHVVSVTLQSILRLNGILDLIVISLEFLSFRHHAFHVLF